MINDHDRIWSSTDCYPCWENLRKMMRTHEHLFCCWFFGIERKNILCLFYFIIFRKNWRIIKQVKSSILLWCFYDSLFPPLIVCCVVVESSLLRECCHKSIRYKSINLNSSFSNSFYYLFVTLKLLPKMTIKLVVYMVSKMSMGN